MKPLYYPVKYFSINQNFGNVSPIYTNQGLKGHNGIDLFTRHGQEVYATHDGICSPQVDDHGGNGIVLTGDKILSIYWHLLDSNAVVHTGQVVKAGDLIGYADSTGVSTGDHLHFGFQIKDETFDPYNGYNGYIDPLPYFNGKYAQDISNPPLTFSFTKTLMFGKWSNDIKQLQMLLQREKLYEEAIDGVFGPKTLLGVKSFQIAHNLKVDGIVGQKTNLVLNSLMK